MAASISVLYNLPDHQFQYKKPIKKVSKIKCKSSAGMNGEVDSMGDSTGDSFQFTGQTAVVDFRRVIQLKDFNKETVHGVSNKEVLHALVALYSSSLPEITEDILYSTVCSKGAKTILVTVDTKTGGILLKSSLSSVSSIEETNDNTTTTITTTTTAESSNEQTTSSSLDDDFTPIERPRLGSQVYSDTESEDSSDSDSDEDPDFTDGSKNFLTAVKSRRTERKKCLEFKQDLPDCAIGIENRVLGCLTYEKAYNKSSEKVINIQLLSVRKRYRRCGIGKYLVSLAKDSTLVGHYDAVFVHSDNTAVQFFSRFGFTDDTLVNTRFSDLAGAWTNCTMMCFLPPFSGQTIIHKTDEMQDLKMMEAEIQKWREKSLCAYQAQVSCVERLRQENISMRALVVSQHELITSLTSDIDRIQREKFIIEKQYLTYKLFVTKYKYNILDHIDSDSDENIDNSSEAVLAAMLNTLEIPKKSDI